MRRSPIVMRKYCQSAVPGVAQHQCIKVSWSTCSELTLSLTCGRGRLPVYATYSGAIYLVEVRCVHVFLIWRVICVCL